VGNSRKNKILDPRQALALSFYQDPTSQTFSNMLQSLRLAGFSETYALSFNAKKVGWYLDNVKSTIELIQSAENSLKLFVNAKVDLNNPDDIDVAKLKLDASKFIAKNLASGKYGDVQNNKDKSPDVHIHLTSFKEAKTVNDFIDVAPST